MHSTSQPILKDLVLIGGGHSNAIVLKMFGMKPLLGLRITLISENSHTPYSGMLPGHIAGFYDFDQSHIDLRPLANFAQAQLFIDKVIGLDLENNKVICANRPDVAFDLLSINIGSTPAIIDIPGANEHAIAVKPVPKFLAEWNQVVEEVTRNPQKPICISIVGGGAGGVELSLTIQSHLHKLLKDAGQPAEKLQINLFHSGDELMPTHNKWVRNHLRKILLQRGIHLHLGEKVCEIHQNTNLEKIVITESDLKVKCDRVFWVTHASAPDWLKKSEIATDEKGFIQINNTLQSLSHPHIFAAGDIATIVNHPRPKSGVFAVRQGKPLFKNLRRFLLEQKLKPYIPQKQFLSLIGTGDESAIASWGIFGWESRLLWRLKDYIDRQFMSRFTNFPEMPQKTIDIEQIPIQNLTSKIQNSMRCAGCASKVSSTTLRQVLQRLKSTQSNWIENEDIIVGLNAPDDAAVVKIPADQLIVHTVDFFRTLINDPFIFGQISTNHCLSDIFAMGATPQTALAIVTIPYASESKQEETLYQLLFGATKVLNQSQTALVGGHTTEGTELEFGLSCNGLVYPDKLLRKSGVQPGQVLILTKALGTGTLFAADMRLKAKGRWIDNAVESMLLSNQKAATCLLEYGATACTDITGFGLIGHLMEIIQASGVAVELELDAIAPLDGAVETLQMGIFSSLQEQNLKASRYISNIEAVENFAKYPLLFDPQTSGGLLAAINPEKVNSCLANLKDLGYKYSRVIGQVTSIFRDTKPIKII